MVQTVSFSVTVITRASVTPRVGFVFVGEASLAPDVSTSQLHTYLTLNLMMMSKDEASSSSRRGDIPWNVHYFGRR